VDNSSSGSVRLVNVVATEAGTGVIADGQGGLLSASGCEFYASNGSMTVGLQGLNLDLESCTFSFDGGGTYTTYTHVLWECASFSTARVRDSFFAYPGAGDVIGIQWPSSDPMGQLFESNNYFVDDASLTPCSGGNPTTFADLFVNMRTREASAVATAQVDTSPVTIDVLNHAFHRVTIATADAFTLTFSPSPKPGQFFTVELVNASGGTTGAITTGLSKASDGSALGTFTLGNGEEKVLRVFWASSTAKYALDN
jgi:hypothetical protein